MSFNRAEKQKFQLEKMPYPDLCRYIVNWVKMNSDILPYFVTPFIFLLCEKKISIFNY